MRTTLDLPDDLLRKAKIAAVTSGITLKEFVSRALARELSSPTKPAPLRTVTFPIFKPTSERELVITEEDIINAELEDDLRGSGL